MTITSHLDQYARQNYDYNSRSSERAPAFWSCWRRCCGRLPR